MGPAAWQWAPPSLRVVRERKVRGCKCNGTGNLGYVTKTLGPGMEVSHAIPCFCLRAILDEDNLAAVEDDLNQHFMANKSDGVLCSCLFCVEKRKLSVGNLLTTPD